MAQNTAFQNAASSQALEQQFTPATAAARKQYGQNILDQILALPGQQQQQQAAANAALTTGTGTAPQVAAAPLGDVGISGRVNTITQGLLQNPAGLPPDVYDYVVRASAANAGQAGLLGGQGANNITARQLGLTSNQLLQQNLGIGQSVGEQQTALAQAQQNMLNQIAQINANLTMQNKTLATGTAFDYANRALPGNSAMSAIFGTPTPATGLSPSNIASLETTNNQNQNNYNMQAAQVAAQQDNADLGFFGQLAGIAAAPFTGGLSLAASSIFSPKGNGFTSTPGGFSVNPVF